MSATDNDRITLNIEISNLTADQAKRVTDFLGAWEWLGNLGSSRGTRFYCDGDGADRFKVLVDGERPRDYEAMRAYINEPKPQCPRPSTDEVTP